MPKKLVPGIPRKRYGNAAPQQLEPSPPEGPQSHERDPVLDRQEVAWRVFWDRYRETRLRDEACYSLPPPLLKSLAANVKGLLSPTDLTFERKFFEAASFGVFCGHTLGNVSNPSAEHLALDQSTQTAVQSIQSMLDQERARIGIHPHDFEDAKARRQMAGDRAASKRHGYVGWLISNPLFRGELADLQVVAAGKVQMRGCFPKRSQLASSVAVHQSSVDVVDLRLLNFYRRWSLERLLTWDWPQPMHPEFLGSLLHPPESSTQAGISLFLPWSVLHGGQVVDTQLISALKISAVPEHLRDWVDPRAIACRRRELVQ